MYNVIEYFWIIYQAEDGFYQIRVYQATIEAQMESSVLALASMIF